MAYLHVAKGSVHVNGEQLDAGDAIMLAQESSVQIEQGKDAEVLLFDLPPAAKPRMVGSH